LADVWSFEWRSTWDDVWSPAFVNQWRRMLATASTASVYHEPDLVRAWADTHGAAIGAEPLFGIARRPDGSSVLLTFIVVTQRGRRAARRSLTTAGEAFFGYQDPLLAGAAADAVDWSDFWCQVRAATAPWCDQGLVRFVHAPLAAGPLSVAAGDPSPVLSLVNHSTLDDVLARCSGNHRREVRAKVRKLTDAAGPLSLWVASAQDVSEAADDFAAHFLPAYAAVWSRPSLANMFERPGVQPFVERVIADGIAAGWCQYAVLRAGGRPVAWHIGLQGRRACYWWIPTYDAQFAAHSPGRVLVAFLIERCLVDGFSSFHFLTGDHRYKSEWRPEPSDLRTVRWHAPTLKGAVLRWYDRRHTPAAQRESA